MRLTRAILIIGFAGILTSWLVAGNPGRPDRSDVRPAAPATAETTPIGPEGVERLERRMAAMPPLAAAARRNPFRFERQTGAPVQSGQGGRGVASEPLPEAPPRPDVRLLGIASDAAEAGGRTAVISSGSELFLVREGEQVALRFLVRRIEADAVELQDVLDDSALRLALR